MQQSDLARDGAAKLITAAATYADEEIRTAARQAAAEITSTVRAQLQPFRPNTGAVSTQQLQTIIWSFVAIAASFVTAAGILYLIWGQTAHCEASAPLAANQIRVQQR